MEPVLKCVILEFEGFNRGLSVFSENPFVVLVEAVRI